MTALLASLVGVLPLALAVGQPPAYPNDKMLIETRDLDQQKVLVLDARKPEDYRKGHVPSAVRVDVEAWRMAFAEGQDLLAWARRLGAVGIDGRTPVVVYDDNNFLDAARIWFILRFWGIDDVRLLNGGYAAWVKTGGTPEQQAATRTAVVRLKPHAERLATKQQVLNVLKNKREQLFDARSFGEYCGTVAKAERGGAIPGAVHLEWSDVLDKKTHRFKSGEELTKLFKNAGVDLNEPAVTYCQSGGRASVLAFALELMGGKQVRNYYRSWAEWGNDPDMPVVKKK
jgi:thiosulfate/3-mercaptopyruvate sulfurtransferase